MKKSSITFTALVLILLVVLFLALRVWATSQAVSITGPSTIHQGTEGTIYIMSNDFLYLHDKNGGLLDKISMSKFGINHVIGEFWVYRNGDLLLRRPVNQRLTVSGQAEMFARTGAGEKDRLDNGESILERCSVTTFACKNFGAGKDVFDKLAAFTALPDEEKGITYLSDTVGHQLLMLGEDGTIIKKSTTLFQFPNQIILNPDGLLYVADTNNHRIAAVRTEQDNYGTIEKEFRITHPWNPLKPSWPMALAHVANKWWIINADDNMSNGIVMMLNENGAFEKVVRLPRGADPLRLVQSGDRVLISDPKLMRVYSVDQTGSLRDDFGSLTFKFDLSDLRRERHFYEAISALSMWALVILLPGALLLARLARVQAATDSSQSAELIGSRPVSGTIPRRDSETRRYDYHNLIGFHRIKFTVLTVLLFVAFAFFFLISRRMTLFNAGFFPAALLGHCAISFFSYLQFKRTYVEINEQGITYQGMARNIRSPWSGIKKINVYGSTSKITTDYGNFSVGLLEPADTPPAGWLEFTGKRRLKYHKDMIDDIQRHAPQVKVNVSWLVRYQWNRMPTAGPAAVQTTGGHAILDFNEAKQLDRAWMTINIIWGSLVGSLAVYLLVCKLMVGHWRPMAADFPLDTMRVVLFFISAATFFAISHIRKAILKITDRSSAFLVAGSSTQFPHPAAGKYTTAIIVAMALSESIAVYGMVLFFMSKDSLTLYLFILMSAISMFYYRPRKEELLQVAAEMQKLSTRYDLASN